MNGTPSGPSSPAASASPAPPLRVGCLPYLNARVMSWQMPAATPAYALEFHAPRTLAGKLAAGELDLALVSSIEYFRYPDYVILPGLSISSRSEMWSMRLFLRCPLPKARRLGLDPDSLTGNALLQILLREKHQSRAELVALAPGEDALGRADLDGFLKIGDPALALRWPGLTTLDLMADWHDFTHLPFVFALWLTRRGTRLNGFDKRLMQTKSEGLRQADAIARECAAGTGLDVRRAREYVAYVVNYELGPQELGGLSLFKRYLLRQGLIEQDRSFEFYR